MDGPESRQLVCTTPNLKASKDTSEAWSMFFKRFFRQFVQAISIGTVFHKFNNSDEFLYFGTRHRARPRRCEVCYS